MRRGEAVGLAWWFCRLSAKLVSWGAGRLAEKLFPGAPQEAKGTVFGAALGAAIGAMIGGIGVAALGGAIGLSATAVFAVVGGLIGNRWGIGRDKKAARAAKADY